MPFITNWIDGSQACIETLAATMSKALTQPDSALFTPSVSSGLQPYTYAWTITGGTAGTDYTNNTGDLTSPTLDLTISTAGTYNISLTVTDTNSNTVTVQDTLTYGQDTGSFSNSFSNSFSTTGQTSIS